MTFKEFLEMWDTPGQEGESGQFSGKRRPSDGQPSGLNPRGGVPRANSGGGGGGFGGVEPMSQNMPMMKKKMRKKMKK